MKKITLTLTIDETNLILSALGELPFSKVHQLISTIQQQASSQLSPQSNGQQQPEVAPTEKE